MESVLCDTLTRPTADPRDTLALHNRTLPPILKVNHLPSWLRVQCSYSHFWILECVERTLNGGRNFKGAEFSCALPPSLLYPAALFFSSLLLISMTSFLLSSMVSRPPEALSVSSTISLSSSLRFKTELQTSASFHLPLLSPAQRLLLSLNHQSEGQAEPRDPGTHASRKRRESLLMNPLGLLLLKRRLRHRHPEEKRRSELEALSSPNPAIK